MAIKYKRRNKRPRRRGPEHFVNERIRVPQVRLIDAEGENVGVIDTRKALGMARDSELDLVLISEKANPPVAKILEYSKFLYDERKKQSAQKTKSHKSDTKEFVFGPSIGEGDLKLRIDRTREFIEDGNRVKMTIRLRGREKAHPDIAIGKMNTVAEALNDVAKPEQAPRLKGNLISVIFVKK